MEAILGDPFEPSCATAAGTSIGRVAKAHVKAVEHAYRQVKPM
jgi:hypothetical protein